MLRPKALMLSLTFLFFSYTTPQVQTTIISCLEYFSSLLTDLSASAFAPRKYIFNTGSRINVKTPFRSCHSSDQNPPMASQLIQNKNHRPYRGLKGASALPPPLASFPTIFPSCTQPQPYQFPPFCFSFNMPGGSHPETFAPSVPSTWNDLCHHIAFFFTVLRLLLKCHCLYEASVDRLLKMVF